MPKKKSAKNQNEEINKVIGYSLLGILIILGSIKLFTIYPALVLIPIVIGIGIIIRLLLKRGSAEKQWKLYWNKLSTLEDIYNNLDPYDFENFVADLYQYYGYKTEVTPRSNDRGKDIVMYKDGAKFVVEVKLYAAHDMIGREKLQKLQGAMLDSGADYAIFVTTSTFRNTAIEYAEENGIILVDGQMLVSAINQRNNASI